MKTRAAVDRPTPQEREARRPLACRSNWKGGDSRIGGVGNLAAAFQARRSSRLNCEPRLSAVVVDMAAALDRQGPERGRQTSADHGKQRLKRFLLNESYMQHKLRDHKMTT
jgi:hypothetical protein